MDFRLLGPLEVSGSDGPLPLGGTKQRLVLAHLLLRANTVVPADRLIDEAWGDEPPAAARNVLQTYVSRLRKTLGSDRLERRPGGYLLSAEPFEIDARRFESLVSEAREAAPADGPAAVALYEEADALWRGPALDDLGEQPSLRGDIAHLEELRAAATEERIVVELALGRHAEAVPELEVLTSRHPHREALWAHLMTALYRSGRQADALAAYHRARETLLEELGLEPSSELRELEQRILRQDPALAAAARPGMEGGLAGGSRRRVRSVAAVVALAGAVAAGVLVFAFGERSDAERERRVAAARGLAAAAIASLDVDTERSVLLALEAVERSRAGGGTVLPEAEDALHRAVVASRIVLRVPRLGGALDWSPDGSVFVTEGPEESGVIDIRNAKTGKSARAFHGHDVDVNLVAFSPDGSRLATSGDEGLVKVWNPATGKRLHSFEAGGDQIWGLAFSPDGSLLAASSWADEAVRIWDLASGRRVRQIQPLTPALTSSFSPDGRRLAIATFDSGAVVADVRTGQVLQRLEGQEGVLDVDWSPDGRWIASSSPDSTVRIWNARTGRREFTLTGHKGEVVQADWSGDSRRLATGSSDGTAKVWEVRGDGARELLSLTAQERGGGLWVAFAPDGEKLMTGDQGISAVKVWDVSRRAGAEWANVPVAPRVPAGVAFTPDGAEVLASRPDGSLAAWDAETGKRAATLRRRAGSRRTPAVAVAAGKTGAVAAAAPEGAALWDPGGRPIAGVPDTEGAQDVAWSADGSLLATATGAGQVRIADSSGKPVRDLWEAATFRIPAVRFSPDGRLVAAARLPTDRPRAQVSAVTLWDWRRRAVVRRLAAGAEALAFSNDGRLIATAPPFGPVHIWETSSGRLLRRLVGHTGAVTDVEFAPRDATVATASADGSVRLWDPDSGRQELLLRGHAGVVSDLAFSPDGTKLASSGREGIARVWALDLDDLVAIAEGKVTRRLTAAECLQYLDEERCG